MCIALIELCYIWGNGNHCEKQAQGKISTSAHSSVPKVGLKNKLHQLGVGHSALKTVVICCIPFSLAANIAYIYYI